jgi:enediyne biosynthesis protein E4
MLWLLACTPSPSDTGREQVEVELTSAGPQTCAQPELRDEAPYLERSLGPAWDEQPWQNDVDGQFSSGSAVVADFDGQHGPDLFVPHRNGSRFYLSQPDGTWKEEKLWLPFGSPAAWVVGGAAADFDGDGDLDLYEVHVYEPDRLLRNEGDHFIDITEAAGLSGEAHDGTSATWADLDCDGDLDLLVNNHREEDDLGQEMVANEMGPANPNQAWRNLGDGTFESFTDELPAEWSEAFTFVSAVEDFTGDGIPDIYAANDFGPQYQPNTLFAGPDWVEAVGTGAEVPVYAMGVGLGDLNGDGWSDMLVTSWDELALLISDGAGGWYRGEEAWGLHPEEDQQASWASELADLDNDGDLDALVMFGPLRMLGDSGDQIEEALGLANPAEQPDAVWLNDGEYFVPTAVEWGLDHDGRGRGLQVMDLNGDGWLDQIKRQQDRPAVALMAQCGEASWLGVRLTQPGLNPTAIGAVVTVDGQRRVVRAGGHSFGGSVPAEVHVGLGEVEVVDIHVRWPDGAESVVEDVDARQYVTLAR